MSPRKLTEDDKNNILQLYRNSEATTSTLAKDFGVSSSTISRFLKNNLSQVEYEELIQQKRLARTHKNLTSDSKKPVLSQDKTDTATTSEPQPKIVSLVSKSEAASETESATEITETQEVSPTSKPEKPLITEIKPLIAQETTSQNLQEEEEDEEEDDELDVITLEEMLGEEVDDEEEDDDEEEEDDDWASETDIAYPHTKSSKTTLQILPLTRASFPRTCYVVIDRAAELITRPLKDFADLGSIPQEEIQQKTLPIFDNHRVAKRFSHRKEKVIKVPDGQMLQKTSRYLHSKGITRLLIDGQIYAVSRES